MGTLRYTILISFLLISVSVCSQDEETIPWSADRKLQWSDFKGSYFKTEWAAAMTATGIGYSFTSTSQGTQQILEIEVQCVFLPQKSWYRPEVCDAIILGHEQLHFDIAELYARKFRKRLAAFNFSDNVKEEVKNIYNKILLELRSFQNKYDRETDFSKDIHQQLLWNQDIETALKLAI